MKTDFTLRVQRKIRNTNCEGGVAFIQTVQTLCEGDVDSLQRRQLIL